MSHSYRLAAGQVWISRGRGTRTNVRSVISIERGLVFYSSGGDTTRTCQRRAFRLWIRRYKAYTTRTRRPRTMRLRA